ncbi:hypothetical protein [Paraburkholderia sp. 22099]|jgi:hypothetical protein|uniref:hypothetical protein n=1 Tax=Paraburkholderia sp. 22099 TaxID=3453875 RepID=UPI003F8388C9
MNEASAAVSIFKPVICKRSSRLDPYVAACDSYAGTVNMVSEDVSVTLMPAPQIEPERMRRCEQRQDNCCPRRTRRSERALDFSRTVVAGYRDRRQLEAGVGCLRRPKIQPHVGIAPTEN